MLKEGIQTLPIFLTGKCLYFIRRTQKLHPKPVSGKTGTVFTGAVIAKRSWIENGLPRRCFYHCRCNFSQAGEQTV
ncbi:hypothetical protein Pcar_3260 [Syntrophotalea carbinolica DSM 2380]|uniref:Uncharacterized protein n=1 Tax=Syntrophotalea carbinolica (strain DSM 2380 / NBRC 103641 / GraBd1) TaxID=338963 RepID=Q0C6Q7_SYNC1|nr:hypothetical protein Pcar_3260 [Syntrophotalea carbinolica DSM 2380]